MIAPFLSQGNYYLRSSTFKITSGRECCWGRGWTQLHGRSGEWNASNWSFCHYLILLSCCPITLFPSHRFRWLIWMMKRVLLPKSSRPLLGTLEWTAASLNTVMWAPRHHWPTTQQRNTSLISWGCWSWTTSAWLQPASRHPSLTCCWRYGDLSQSKTSVFILTFYEKKTCWHFFLLILSY